jgi:predicted PurR-regulated permease PerM
MASEDRPARQPQRPPPPVHVGPLSARTVRPIEPEHLYKAIGLFFLVLIFYAYFAAISRVLLIVYAAAILAVALNVLVGAVPKHRKIISGLLGLTIFGSLGLALWFAVPALAFQLRGLAEELPRFEAQTQQWSEQISAALGMNVELFGPQARAFLSDFFGDAEMIGRAWGIVEGIFLPLVIIIGGLYAVAKPNERLLSPLLNAVPRDRRGSFRELFHLLGKRLRGWVKGTLIAMVAVGALTTLGLWFIGIPYAFLIGVIAGVLEFIPLAGPWVAGIIAVGIALLNDPGSAIWVVLLMFGIQQLESNFITPLVMSKTAEVHPFVTLFALFFFGSLFGFIGIILALPLVLLVWTVVEVLWVDRAIRADGDHIEPLVKEE